jgi:predicted transcriptional regulator
MTQETLLKFFRCHGMSLFCKEVDDLVEQGYLKWVKPQDGVKLFVLTDKGKRAQLEFVVMDRTLRRH